MRRTVASAVIALPVVFVFAVALVAGRGGETVADQSVQHEVTISLDSAGAVAVDPDTVEAYRSDRVRFSSEDGDWWVSFEGETPFRNRQINGEMHGGATVPILPQAATGTYKYTAGLVVEGDSLTLDPDIIVKPPR
jgi:hypothetical protein